jgi:anthranilate synthase/aminodeoxychorismate synthase-like glutamine amidotransferase
MEDFSYLVLSPGPGMPGEAGIAKMVYSKYKNTIPILGVCLGMQAINEVHGGRTVAAPVSVHGKATLIEHDGCGIFSGTSNPTQVARYHSLMIEIVSKDLVVQSRAGGVTMAYRIPDQTVAVQFHPESFLTTDGMLMLQNFLELRL